MASAEKEELQVIVDKASSGKAPLSVARVLQILKALSLSEQPIGLAELSRQLLTPKTSLIGLLRGLVEMNYVVYSDGTYRLGGGSFKLANEILSARQRLHMGDYIKDGMNELCLRSGETVLYGILTGDDPPLMTYVGLAESRSAIRISVGIGDHSQLYCTAGGRVLLAEMPDEAVRDYLAKAPIKQLIQQTETDPETLFARVVEARERGFSCVIDQVVQGITGMAAPVRDSSDRVLGALIVAGHTSRILHDESMLRDMVCDAARSISSSLGHLDRKDIVA
jgi:DNA-binding IclR family transcriptional regulator